jgi:hypothetical protein
MAPEDPSIISPTRPTRISGIFPDSTGTGEEASVSPGHRAGGGHAFSAHEGLGFALAGASLLILVLAVVARAGVMARWLAAILVVQTCLLQSLLDALGDHAAAFGGLHAVDGLLIAASAAVLYARSGRPRRSGSR